MRVSDFGTLSLPAVSRSTSAPQTSKSSALARDPEAGRGECDLNVRRDCFVDVRKFETPAKLAEYLNYLNQNDTAYDEMHEWRRRELPPSFVANMKKSMTTHESVYGEVTHNFLEAGS